MSEPVAPNGPVRRRARMQTWGLIGIALALYGVLRLVFDRCRRLAGVLLGCTLAWLLLRELSSTSGNRPQRS